MPGLPRPLACLVLVLLTTVPGGCRAPAPAAPGSRAESGGETLPLISAGALPITTDDARSGWTVRPGSPTRDAWGFHGHPGWLIATPNYRIHTTIEHERVLDRLPRFLEAALDRYVSALADLPRPSAPLDVFVFHDRRQWGVKTREMIPEQAGMLDRLGRGGFATRGVAILYYIDSGGRDRDTFAIAAHEGWHQYTQQVFRSSLPIWLEEGIATWMEGHQFRGSAEPTFQPNINWERRYALRRGLRSNRLIPLSDLVRKPPQEFLQRSKEDLLLYYGQVWALTRFLVEHDEGRHRAALARLLTDAAAGRLEASLVRAPAVLAGGGRRDVVTGNAGWWVIPAYFTDDVADFERAYLAFAARIAGQ